MRKQERLGANLKCSACALMIEAGLMKMDEGDGMRWKKKENESWELIE